jgi:apolipoprotein N-acyltransferase
MTETHGFLRYLLLVFLGFVSGFAFSPFFVMPVLGLTFPALFFALRSARSGKEAFASGWAFAFGLFVFCLHWIAASFFVELDAFWWALPFAVAGLPAVIALFYGVASLGAWRIGLRRFDGVLFFALCWMAAELARAHLFTGLPWDLLGYVWAGFLPVLQSASLFGIEGLTFLTLLLVLMPCFFFFPQEKKRARFATVVVFSVFAALTFWGYLRVQKAPREFVDGVLMRLVQPAQEQEMKWRPENRLANFQDLLSVTFGGMRDGEITHIIWPETATSYYLTEEPGVRARIAERMPAGAHLITGAVRRQKGADGALHYYNSLIAMNAKGDVVAGYDKHHLVPFGEYFPFRALIPFRVVTALGVDFMAGDGNRSLRVPSLPSFGALVCYEAIFSGDVIDERDPPAFLINVTNDAWYKGTIGPDQHFSIARVRAVEEGIPLVRVANKGTTAIVDPWGRVSGEVHADEKGGRDVLLPKPVKQGTFFQKQRGSLLLCFAAFVLIGALLSRYVKVKA